MRVLFAEYLTWDTPYRVGSHYYARHFLDMGWEVGWLGGEFHALNLLQNRAELARKLPLWARGGVQHEDGPWEYVPLKLLPYRDWGPLRSPRLAWQSHRLTVPPVRRALARRGFLEADLLWLSNPQAYPWLIDEVGYKHAIYRAADNQAAREGVPASVRDIETRIAARAAAVLVVPPDSLERFRQAAPGRTTFLPNGVDLLRFQSMQPMPPEYACIDSPIAVYVGSVNYWFDVELLRDVALQRQDLTFMLIGEPVTDVSALAPLGNVHLLGPRSPEDVVGYLQHAHVGLLPFRDTPVTRDVRSLKMYEYMASGIPVIHTSMSAQAAAGLPILLAHDPATFCEALDAALASSPSERAVRLAFAQENTWESRYAIVDRLLEAIL